MKKILKTTSVLMLLLVAALLLASCSPKKDPGDKDAKPETVDKSKVLAYFPLKEDNRWVYRAQVVTVLTGNENIETNTMMTYRCAGDAKMGTTDTVLLEGYFKDQLFQREFYEITNDALIAHKRVMYTEGDDELESQMEPPEPMLKLPMEDFKSWSWEGTMTRIETKDGPVETKGRFDFKVSKKEEVTTPAGTFEAYRVEMDGSANDGSRVQSTRWYAENVGMVREISRVTYNVDSQKAELDNLIKQGYIKPEDAKNYTIIETVDITADLRSYTIDGITTPIPGRGDTDI